MPDIRIYNFQIPGTTPTNGLKSDNFYESCKGACKYTLYITTKTVDPSMKVMEIEQTVLVVVIYVDCRVDSIQSCFFKGHHFIVELAI